MTDLIVLVPTRGRPHNVRRLQGALASLNQAATKLVLGVDTDDPERGGYEGLTLRGNVELALVEPAGPGMVGALNQLAERYVDQAGALGFLGDDHLPRTAGWDARLLAALAAQGGGVAYGNDLVHGPNLATAVVLDARIPAALGYMAPPSLRHLYVDNVWLDWGRELGKLTYLPDVVIEHLHPIVGKAPEDERYAAVNTGEMFNRDRAAYEAYVAGNLGTDLALLEVRA